MVMYVHVCSSYMVEENLHDLVCYVFAKFTDFSGSSRIVISNCNASYDRFVVYFDKFKL